MGKTEAEEGSNGERDGILEIKPRCQSCPLWEEQVQKGPVLMTAGGKAPKQGHCHLNPPQMIPIPAGQGAVNIQSIFTVTMSDSWCSWHPENEVSGA